MKLIPLPAFTDNYIWMLHDAHQALVVDPGDAQPVLAALQHLSVQLEAILVTHYHLDHTGAVDALHQAKGAKLFGPTREPMPEPLTRYTVAAQGLRSRQQPTLPSAIRLERQINPFLRTREAAVMQAAQGFDASASDEVSIFAAPRRWKKEYQ